MEFHTVRSEKGRLVMTPKRWIESTNAIGITSKAGRYGGTYAHTDIAFEFASWISPEFKLYVIKEYQRLKADESNRLSLDWNLRRELSKVNYKIHTDSIKEYIIPTKLTYIEKNCTYANEADILNLALFGMTAKQWRSKNSDKKGNIRDYATIDELLVLSNLENYNSIMISQNIPQAVRLRNLNIEAIRQMKNLQNGNRKSLNEIKMIESRNDKKLK